MNKQQAADILGLGVNATTDAVKAKVRALSAKYHPDKHSEASDDLKELAAEKFKQVREAGQVMLGLSKSRAQAQDDAADEVADEMPQEVQEQIDALSMAEDYLNNGLPGKAVMVLRELLARDPSDVMANYYMGLAGAELQNWNMSAEYMNRVVTFAPDNEHAWHNLALAELNRGSHASAVHAVEQAMALAPEIDGRYIELLATIYIASGDAETADHYINELAKLSPYNRLVLDRKSSYRIGKRYIDKGDAGRVAAGTGCCICGILECLFDCI